MIRRVIRRLIRRAGPGAALVLAAAALCASGCLASYKLSRNAEAPPADAAVVIGRLADEDGRSEWSILLEHSGDVKELPVPRGGWGVFAWILDPGEWRLSALRRFGTEGSSLPGTTPTPTEVVLRSAETPWFVLEAGGVYCLGNILPLSGPRRSILGSVEGTFRYDADCSFEDIPESGRPAARWPKMPWGETTVRDLPIGALGPAPEPEPDDS